MVETDIFFHFYLPSAEKMPHNVVFSSVVPIPVPLGGRRVGAEVSGSLGRAILGGERETKGGDKKNKFPNSCQKMAKAVRMRSNLTSR